MKRRFTRVGEWQGATIIDDYGHHPVEIAAVLKAARQAFSGPVIAIMQPHRYTRLRDLFDQFCTCFNSADTAMIAPVYAAGEAPIEGINRDILWKACGGMGTSNGPASTVPMIFPLAIIAPLVGPGGAIVCLRAGSITQWAAGTKKLR